MVVGLRVVRGPDWKYDNQDGGPNHVGTLTETLDGKNVNVKWDMGQTTICRTGANGKFDLKIFDSAPLGKRHSGIVCGACGEKNFCGMRWKCSVCDDYDLCTPCYFDDSHLPTHPFILFESPDDNSVKLPKRLTSQRERVMGVFPGAVVMKGPDIEKNDFSNGTVEDHVSFNRGDDAIVRDAVSVVSHDDSTHVLRLGFKGKVDVICAEKSSGPNYYPDHLPVVDSTKYNLPDRVLKEDTEVDDLQICVAIPVHEFRRIQQTRYKWCSMMEELVYNTVKVQAFTEEGDYIVNYYDSRIAIHKDAASKVPRHKKGDIVKVIEDLELLQSLQIRQCGWLDGIQKVTGLTGKVTAIDKDGDVGVAFQNADFVFHPLALVPIDIAQERENATDDAEDLEATKDKHSKENTSRGHIDVKDLRDALGDLAKLMLLETLVRSQGADVKIRFLKAVFQGRADDVGMLLQRFPKLKDIKHEGVPCLSYAAHECHFGVIKVMLEAGSDIDLRDDNGLTPLMRMIIKDNLRAARFLIESGADVRKTNENEQTVLHMAVRGGTEQAVKLLLDKNCDPNRQDKYGDTPLHDAIDKENDDSAHLLIKWPTLNVWLKNKKGFNVLVMACRKPHLTSVEALVGRTPALVNSKEGRTAHGSYPLHVAAINENVKEMRVLLEKGKADVECRDGNSATPLQLAAEEAHSDAVKLLLSSGADCNTKDKSGNTPLHNCLLGKRKRSNEEMMILLLMGIGSRLENAERKVTAELLIVNGANTRETNNDGKTALEACSDQQLRMEVRRLLIDRTRGLTDQLMTPSQSMPSLSSRNPATQTTNRPSGIQWCMRCSENKIDTIFWPCQHKIACSKCCKRYNICPVCRQSITEVTDKGYLSTIYSPSFY